MLESCVNRESQKQTADNGESGGSIIDICHATVRGWEAALHDPCFVTFDFGWGPPGSGARGLIAMEQKTGVDQSRLR